MKSKKARKPFIVEPVIAADLLGSRPPTAQPPWPAPPRRRPPPPGRRRLARQAPPPAPPPAASTWCSWSSRADASARPAGPQRAGSEPPAA